MILKKRLSQIENLTPDHKSPWNKGQMIFDWSVQYIIGKIIFPLHAPKNIDLRKI
jgi:hypothetical protein